MHWDGTISVGNLLTIIVGLAGVLMAFWRFTVTQAKHTNETTLAINNLAMITDSLQKAVSVQNGRVAKLEIAKAVDEGIEARLAAMGGVGALIK